MFPEIIIFNISISLYPLCVATGFLIGMIIAELISYKFYLSKNESYLLMCLVEIGVLIGGKLLYLIINYKILSNYYNKYGFFGVISKTGYVFYGALLGGLFAVFLFSKFKKKNFLTTTSLVLTVCPLIHSFGRLGCFCAGCCYGKHWDNKYAVYIKNDYRYPVQLFESFLNLILFIVLIVLVYKNRTRIIVYLYIFLYGLIRLIMELFRGDEKRGFIGSLSISTWISIFFIIVGIMGLYLSKVKIKNEQSY